MEQTHKQLMIEALVQIALLESKELSVRLAEVIAYLQKGQHLAALGTLQGTPEHFTFLDVILKAAARIHQN